MKGNDPRGAKRGPYKNHKVKLQYYLVNNTIQEAKLQYYLVNNTIQKSVFYGFSWELHSYAVNNTIQEGPKAANWAQTATPGACKSYLPWLPASPPFPTNPPLAPRVLLSPSSPLKSAFRNPVGGGGGGDTGPCVNPWESHEIIGNRKKIRGNHRKS